MGARRGGPGAHPLPARHAGAGRHRGGAPAGRRPQLNYRPTAVRSQWQVRDRVFDGTARTLVIGILNVTPDSFSDGGRYLETDAAIAHGQALAAQGADLVDVGGESTRPGSEAVSAEEELRRVLPVVAGLAEAGVAVSIDTSKAAVAAAAVDAGAVVVNDVTALGDPDMGAVIAGTGCGLVLMHMQGTPRSMQDDPAYGDVVAEVRHHLAGRAARAEAMGVERDRICIDPGIGFGKTVAHNLALLRRLDELVAMGRPVLVGTSRKSTVAKVVGSDREEDRDHGTAATIALAIAAGAAAVRVHNVAMGARVAQMADAIVRPEFTDGAWR